MTPSLSVFHWHGDTFDVPEGATLLAFSAAYLRQAFRYGDAAYGLQFHIEPDQGTWSAWREHLPCGMLEGKELKQQLIEQAGSASMRERSTAAHSVACSSAPFEANAGCRSI